MYSLEIYTITTNILKQLTPINNDKVMTRQDLNHCETNTLALLFLCEKMLVLNTGHIFIFQEKFSGKNKSVIYTGVDVEIGTGRRRIYSSETEFREEIHTS